MCRLFSVALLWGCCLFLIVPTASAQYGYHFGRNKVQYEDFEWEILKTEHFDIYHYPEMQELAEMGAAFAETVYTELEHRFDLSLNHRVPMIFYSSNLHFKQTNVTSGFIPDGVGGFFEFLKGRVVVPANGNLHRFRRVIRHELVHVFTYSKVLRVMRDHRKPLDRFLPLWFTEGLAEYWSGPPDYQHEMVIRDAVASNFLVPLANMFRINGTYLMYKQGEAVLRFIAEEYGDDKVLRLLENVWKDRDFRKVMEVTLHESYTDISTHWDEWVRAQYYPMLEDIDVPTLIAGGISAKGFSAKPVLYQKQNGERWIYYVGNKTGYSNVFAVPIDSTYRPLEKSKVIIEGERDSRFEAFHVLESRIDVSADGKLAFVTKSGKQDVVHIYDLEEERLLSTYRFPELVAVYSPSWNPEGNQLVFTSIDKSGFTDLYQYDIQEDLLRRLTNDAYDDRDPSWSPDGRYVAFSSDRTSEGKDNAYNLFIYDLEDDHIRYLTYGHQHDLSPSWSPDGQYVVFTSTRPDSTGRYSAQDLWVADATQLDMGSEALASVGLVNATKLRTSLARPVHKLTNLTSAAFDPVWTDDGRLLFTAFEHFSFSIRNISDVDSLVAEPRKTAVSRFDRVGTPWAFNKMGQELGAEKVRYKKHYQLDIAQSQVNNNPVWGTNGGAFVALSDMMGDDYWYFTLFSNSRAQGNFLRSLNFSVSRLQLHRRTNTAYGIYRFGGLRYDITDPLADTTFPIFWETIWGGFGALAYPISKFRRIELNTSLSWSDKEISIRNIQRKALLLSNSIALVHDNALYHYNGPIEGWRANLTAAYTTDIKYSNVSYFTLAADIRKYWRIIPEVTFASRGLFQMNEGQEARLFVLGGSWDLRGYPLWDVRGRKMWFTSHELRFPILNQPGRYLPILVPFGIVNLRGALFFDMAHAWNFKYNDAEPLLYTGDTIGSSGLGFRLNLFGGLILRYDIGYRFSNGAKDWEKERFGQFFFGWDF